MSLSPKSRSKVRAFYQELFDAWGPQHWWPAETRFEVIVGAYLTQNTAWTNVTRALNNLREIRSLNVDAIRDIRLEDLEQLIRSAGYFRQKAQRLKTFVAFLDSNHGGDLDKMFAQNTQTLREQLLALNGVGPETADSILLYAGNHPVFVVDAYTRRIFERHALSTAKTTYEEIRRLVETALSEACDTGASKTTMGSKENRGAVHPPSAMSMAPRTALVQTFNQMHALIVGVGKNYCLKSLPDCEVCPLRTFLGRGKARNAEASIGGAARSPRVV